MSVDLNEIEKKVIASVSSHSFAFSGGDKDIAQLYKSVVKVSAQVVTAYMKEYLEATKSD